ncbi:MAG: hypothetical protein ACERKD_05165 [Prolixibacteraceae bacterium]
MWSCQPDLEYSIHGYTEKIIVEGSIANGEFPRVYLSLNVPLWLEVDSATILDKVIRTAKVTVSDGEHTEILTSRWDREHFPPYVYRGTELKGETGKTYSLTVEHSGYTIRAQTTIPAAPVVRGFNILTVENSDSLRILSTIVDIDSASGNGYRFYSKKQQDGFFVETPIVYNDQLSLYGEQEFMISPKPKAQFPSFDEGSYFMTGDSVFVKVCTIDSTTTNFFNSFSIDNFPGKDFFLGEHETLNSNITLPGFGIWYGYGVKNYLVVIE